MLSTMTSAGTPPSADSSDTRVPFRVADDEVRGDVLVAGQRVDLLAAETCG